MKEFLRGFFVGVLICLFIFCCYLILSGNAFDKEVERNIPPIPTPIGINIVGIK